MTENTKTLLRLLAFEGEVPADKIADRTRLSFDEIRAAAVEGLFEVWAHDEGRGEPVSVKLTTDGYTTARRMLRYELAPKVTKDACTCFRPRPRGPFVIGKPGAFCENCHGRIECPHPEYARLQARPIGGPVGPASCKWCGDPAP